MNKIDKYLRRFAYKVVTSESKQSRYYTIGELIVRVSDHIGKNSSGNISIIIDRENYILYVPSTNKVSLIPYEDCKALIKGIVLHATLFLVGEPSFQKSLVKENQELKTQVKTLECKIRALEKISKCDCTDDISIDTIKVILNGLTKGQKKRVKELYGSHCFSGMTKEKLRLIWNNKEVQRWIQSE